MSNCGFSLEVLVDFPDDCMVAAQPITHQHIDSMMAAFKAVGIKRVIWSDLADCYGGPLLPGASQGDDQDTLDRPGIVPAGYINFARTYDLLGNPLKVAVEAAHRHELEIYAYFKPYETGIGLIYPEGSPESRIYGRLAQIGGRLSWINRFVNDHPHLRIARRTDDLPVEVDDPKKRPICSIKLIKKDDSSTRIRSENLQIWISDLNYKYQRLEVPFTLTETIEPALSDVRDGTAVANINDTGARLTRQGDPVRVLTLSGMHIEAPFIVVTTNFVDGESDFENAATDMIRVLDAEGKEIVGSVATSASIWRIGKTNFRTDGLDFDYGWGRERTFLDSAMSTPAPGWPATNGLSGFIGYARGRNAYLPGALCETEPEVQAYWLRWLSDTLDSGIDGIDIREENHSCGTDHNRDYGYNPAVIEACAGDLSPANIARVRGNAYSEFLRRAKALCVARGKRMRINFQIDYYRPDPPLDRLSAYPANLDFQWRRWIEEGLCDEAILRFFSIKSPDNFEDPIALEVLALCEKHGLPISFNRYVNSWHSHKQSLIETYKQVRKDGRYCGFIIYEAYNFVAFEPDGTCNLFFDDVLNLLELAQGEKYS